jgi:hypothetical protein
VDFFAALDADDLFARRVQSDALSLNMGDSPSFAGWL